jgi:hypothetical protein
VHWSKKSKIGWHAAPGFRLGAWMWADGIVERLREVRLDAWGSGGVNAGSC